MSSEVTRRDAMKALLSAATASSVGLYATGAVRADDQGPTSAPETSSAEGLPWYRRLLVGIEWGATGLNMDDPAYVSRASGSDIVRLCVKARAEYAVIFLKDSYAYYASMDIRRFHGMSASVRFNMRSMATSSRPRDCRGYLDTTTPAW